MQLTKIRRFEESFRVTFSADTLSEMGWKEGDALHIVRADGALILRALSPSMLKVARTGSSLLEQHYDVLRALGPD